MEALDAREQWLGELRSLARLMHECMAALAACHLEAFESLHHSLRELCDRLQSSMPRHQHGHREAPPYAEEHALASQMHAAAADIERLNRQYAAFLRHANRTLQAHIALERGCAGQIHPEALQARSHHSWSYEV